MVEDSFAFILDGSGVLRMMVNLFGCFVSGSL